MSDPNRDNDDGDVHSWMLHPHTLRVLKAHRLTVQVLTQQLVGVADVSTDPKVAAAAAKLRYAERVLQQLTEQKKEETPE